MFLCIHIVDIKFVFRRNDDTSYLIPAVLQPQNHDHPPNWIGDRKIDNPGPFRSLVLKDVLHQQIFRFLGVSSCAIRRARL